MLFPTKYEDAWLSVDPLGRMLHFLRMSGIFCSRPPFSAVGHEIPRYETRWLAISSLTSVFLPKSNCLFGGSNSDLVQMSH